MKKFKYLKISNTKKLRYIVNYFRKNLYIIFLPGFMSDIEGEKPQTLLKFAQKNKLGFLSLEYSGHGKSSGIFTKGNISIWSKDAKNVIRKIETLINASDNIITYLDIDIIKLDSVFGVIANIRLIIFLGQN